MKLSLVSTTALALGSLSALGAVALPASVLNGLLASGGMAGLVQSVAPSLGEGARLLFAAATGGVGGSLGACAAWMLVRRDDVDPLATSGLEDAPVPVIRRADAHPDARPRAPLRAQFELGSPVPVEAPLAAEEPVIVERALPADLDQPLAAFDPLAIPAAPIPPPVPRRRERSEQGLTRVAGGAGPDRIVRPETDASVHALLERLERGVIRRHAAQTRLRERSRPERALDDALATLRNLARQA